MLNLLCENLFQVDKAGQTVFLGHAGLALDEGQAVVDEALVDTVVSLVANTEKKVPLEWINAEHNGVTQGFIDYCLPLIQGETGMVKEDGLPRFVQLKKVFAK